MLIHVFFAWLITSCWVITPCSRLTRQIRQHRKPIPRHQPPIHGSHPTHIMWSASYTLIRCVWTWGRSGGVMHESERSTHDNITMTMTGNLPEWHRCDKQTHYCFQSVGWLPSHQLCSAKLHNVYTVCFCSKRRQRYSCSSKRATEKLSNRTSKYKQHCFTVSHSVELQKMWKSTISP